MNPNQIIDSLGGTTVVAALFEIRTASVSQWRINGIPKARMQLLKLLHPELFNIKPKPKKRPRVAA